MSNEFIGISLSRRSCIVNKNLNIAALPIKLTQRDLRSILDRPTDSMEVTRMIKKNDSKTASGRRRDLADVEMLEGE